SRRRHTRSKRDWSSDVCSSDLDEPRVGDGGVGGEEFDEVHHPALVFEDLFDRAFLTGGPRQHPFIADGDLQAGHEEGGLPGTGEIGRASCRDGAEIGVLAWWGE